MQLLLLKSATSRMFLKKTDWFKSVAGLRGWLSPLLMISLAFHGLAMLIPLSEKEEIVEEPEDVALPDPITVTTLPKRADADSPAASSAIDSNLNSRFPDAPLPASPVPQQAIAPLPPALAPAPIPTNPSLPAQPSPAATQPTTTPSPTNPLITQQRYSDSGATDIDQIQKGGQFAANYGRPKDIRLVLELIYAAQGNCFDQDTNLEASVGIVANDQGRLAASELLKTTGYPVIDDWLTDYISLAEPLPNDVFTQLQQTIPTAPDSGDLLDWLNAARDSSEPLVAAGQGQAPYAFKVAVKLEGNQCNLP